MFSKKERRQKDGKEVAMELGLGELVFADKVSFQSPVEDAEREYFTGQRSREYPYSIIYCIISGKCESGLLIVGPMIQQPKQDKRTASRSRPLRKRQT